MTLSMTESSCYLPGFGSGVNKFTFFIRALALLACYLS